MPNTRNACSLYFTSYDPILHINMLTIVALCLSQSTFEKKIIWNPISQNMRYEKKINYTYLGLVTGDQSFQNIIVYGTSYRMISNS